MNKSLSTLCVLLGAFAALCPLPCRADLPVFTVLHTFGPGGPDDLTPSHHANQDGAEPESPLVQGFDGALYGTAASGGAHGTGVVFRVNGNSYTVLHSFEPLDALFTNDTNSDGGRPEGALVIGKDGALYGVTAVGGPKGSGTVFRLTTNGSQFTVLHSFDPKGELYHNDGGANPVGLTLSADGTLFGAAELGGEGRGLIFKMLPSGKGFHVLHSFDDPAQEGNLNDGGAIPSATVTLGPDGKLYGTTRQGGFSDGGIAYKISTDGAAFTVLHTFSALDAESQDGTDPAGPVVIGSGGYIYGVSGGGGETGFGLLFKIRSDGSKFFVLHDFSKAEGGAASAGLTLGRDGNLYGVSAGGGANKTGTIFRVTIPAAK